MKTIEMFDGERATHYDTSIRKWFPNYDNLAELLFPILKSRLSKDQSHRVLVVGSGTGNELYSLASIKPTWELVGVDPSAIMNQLAREKTKELSNVKIVEGTVHEVDGNFDAATCILVTHFFDTNVKKAIFQKVFDLLEPGGTFILADITGSKKAFNENFELYKGYQLLNIEDDTLEKGLHHIENELFYISEEELTGLLKSVGFKKVNKFFQWLIFDAWVIEK
ncbi:class I SAM-dependent methyltransferase [Pedobacter sp. SYSU D00535]|uniref:class I SAM-dependent methyltransferase n=1 Tax=Pedobacter sp. SYSU D00535 TaxID=2810308 RepID=UPI001A95DF4E|nr:class I SAM-dependent methyltransferase [Pedobacter sp. SYSU D00535]